MSDNGNGKLKSVAWSQLCPWLCILRTFRLAISFRVLLLAAVAGLLTLCGWCFFAWVFPGGSGPNAGDLQQVGQSWPTAGCPWTAINKAIPDRVPLADPGALANATRPNPGGWPLQPPFLGTWAELSRPLWQVFGPGMNFSRLACLILCGLWSLAIWALFGGAITRMAAVQLTCDERVGWAAALRFASSRWLAYFCAPLFPLIGLVIAAVPAWLLGWLLRFEVGMLLTALLWPLLLLIGLLMAVLLLGLVFGWPLMWAAISTEGTDSFGALQRSYAYVFGRPLHYLFYALVATLLGLLGWLLVCGFASTTVGLAYWPAGWTAGSTGEAEAAVPRIDAIIGERAASPAPAVPSLVMAPLAEEAPKPAADTKPAESFGALGSAGVWLIHLWAGCVKLLAVGFLYGYFWTAMTAVYLLLRHDEDATEMDEVFLDEDASEAGYGLPPLETDEAGAPVVSDEVPETGPDQPQEPCDDPS